MEETQGPPRSGILLLVVWFSFQNILSLWIAIPSMDIMLMRANLEYKTNRYHLVALQMQQSNLCPHRHRTTSDWSLIPRQTSFSMPSYMPATCPYHYTFNSLLSRESWRCLSSAKAFVRLVYWPDQYSSLRLPIHASLWHSSKLSIDFSIPRFMCCGIWMEIPCQTSNGFTILFLSYIGKYKWVINKWKHLLS